MNYQNGKIYKITNCIDDEVYVCSTCSTLSKRFSTHKSKIYFDTSNLFRKMIDIGTDKFSISLVENYPCTNKTELLRRENEYIDQIGTLNQQFAYRSREERSALCSIKNKQYYIDNCDEIKNKAKKYRDEHKEKVCESHKKWREMNKERLNDKKKEYYENSKEKQLQRQKSKVKCELCNKTVSHGNLPRHKKSTACVAVSAGNMNACKGSQA